MNKLLLSNVVNGLANLDFFSFTAAVGLTRTLTKFLLEVH